MEEQKEGNIGSLAQHRQGANINNSNILNQRQTDADLLVGVGKNALK